MFQQTQMGYFIFGDEVTLVDLKEFIQAALHQQSFDSHNPNKNPLLWIRPFGRTQWFTHTAPLQRATGRDRWINVWGMRYGLFWFMLQNSTRNLNQQDGELVHVSVINKLLLRLESSLWDDEFGPCGFCGILFTFFYENQSIFCKWHDSLSNKFIDHLNCKKKNSAESAHLHTSVCWHTSEATKLRSRCSANTKNTSSNPFEVIRRTNSTGVIINGIVFTKGALKSRWGFLFGNRFWIT